MQETSTAPATILQFRQDIEAQLRKEIHEALEVALREELAATLASERHERTDRRRGYRNGVIERTITTTDGTRTVQVPRGRVLGRDGATQEFHSQPAAAVWAADPRNRRGDSRLLSRRSE